MTTRLVFPGRKDEIRLSAEQLAESLGCVLKEGEEDECEECAELFGLACFECYMAERGYEV